MGVTIGDSRVKVKTKRNEKRCRKGKHQRKVQKYSNATRRKRWENWRKRENEKTARMWGTTTKETKLINAKSRRNGSHQSRPQHGKTRKEKTQCV